MNQKVGGLLIWVAFMVLVVGVFIGLGHCLDGTPCQIKCGKVCCKP